MIECERCRVLQKKLKKARAEALEEAAKRIENGLWRLYMEPKPDLDKLIRSIPKAIRSLAKRKKR